jgi:uncharacterized protein YcfL
MKNLCLLALLLFGLSACMNNQVVPLENQEQSESVDTRAVNVKTVKEYIESNEFIDVIPDEGSVVSRSALDEKAHLYQMMAVMYRFYKHCTMDEKGFITCNISSGKEINVSEEAFDMRMKEMKSWNDRIEDKIRNGVKYKVVRIDDEYFKNLLNFK